VFEKSFPQSACPALRYRKKAFSPEEKKILFRGKCFLKKSKMKWKREEDRHDIRRII
jgi:hypothetical protein